MGGDVIRRQDYSPRAAAPIRTTTLFLTEVPPPMLRIDETSKTLVAPQEAAFVAEAPPAREELLALVSSGWNAFAAEIGQPQLAYALAGAAGADVVAIDAAAGRITVVQVADEPQGALSAALSCAAAMAGRDSIQLAELHTSLGAAVPGDSPRILLVGASWDDETVATMDWLVRRHGLEISAYTVQTLRCGAERMLDVSRAYPAPEVPAPADAAAFLATVAPPAPGATVAPPGVSAPPPSA